MTVEAQNGYGSRSSLAIEREVADYHKSGGSQNAYLNMLYQLGLAYTLEGHSLKARDTLSKALELKGTVSGKTDSTYSNILTSYADALIHVGAFDQAKRALMQSLKLNRDIHGEMSHQVIHSLNNLANLFEQVGLNLQSLDLFQTALSISRQKYGANHLNTAECLSNVGALISKTETLSSHFAMLITPRKSTYNTRITSITSHILRLWKGKVWFMS